jgi:hypothetical protein
VGRLVLTCLQSFSSHLSAIISILKDYQMKLASCRTCTVTAIISFGTPAFGVVNPFTEHFAADHANWYNSTGAAPVEWVSSGGPDGSSYVSNTFNFMNQAPGVPFPGNVATLFRAQPAFGSSNHAFEGDWINSGVSEFSFWVRHDAPVSMMFFTRFATPNNFPAWSGVDFTPVAANVWTRLSISIYFGNPNLFYSGTSGGLNEYNAVFGNIGNVQVGVYGGDMAGVNQQVRFDLDQPSIIPTPPALLMLIGAIAIPRRRRRDSA